ncbi:hypothetical protein K9U39_08320 [Rhodoblastus acidophilus]|uniref:Phosphate transport regulator n=1 Tax=Candidatus Rhodoblastus alkanivorans TaxID=2954117 RepID=A0ABS9Z7I1_9HYPH|nr:hypothetical protein [Candidatus Rhodoblastus alkanivorans]MCI4678377.1 hypothetical protein [Candidatus Rhodoblastus alkanivorans]MCI4683635.1 hypothetical protein [Candidatus Rhodoblastus alkanivorans]MDI4640951.1 hypothetical protein [Rhodoblastus acidophilus]
MVGKVAIVESLGERAVLLPALIAEALAANDRLKIRLSLLQEASAHAAEPGRTALTLENERRSVGLDDAALAATVSGARPLDAAHFSAPGAALLASGFAADLDAMYAPIDVARGAAAGALKARLDAVVAALPDLKDDRVAHAQVLALASASREAGDSLHLLVMDLHRAINRLAAETAVEDIDGARAAGLDEGSRARVKAFMRGLNRTAGLAFGHPGLATTAGRVGARLTIQNDIGTTDAHVLVVHVEGLSATTTYTDVHRPRAKFFIALFDGQGVEWSPLGEKRQRNLAEGEVFYLLNGVYKARDEADLDRFLTFLGSRIVFLIDWNKARKALQLFTGKGAAIAILLDAARGDDGHRAFLELGGAELVYEAIRNAASGRIAYGVPLEQALGDEECRGFLRHVLHVACAGLKDGLSTRLIRDEIQADLSQRLGAAERELLTVALRHLGLTRMLAGMIETVLSTGAAASADERKNLARRAKALEAKADRLTLEARKIFARLRDADDLLPFVDEIESAIDALDEAAFLISLAESDGVFAAPLGELSRIVTESAAQMTRAVEGALVVPKGKRLDAAFALQCIAAVADCERAADDAERTAFAAVLAPAPAAMEARVLVLGLEIARALEDATDRLAHAAFSLRARLLQELSA